MLKTGRLSGFYATPRVSTASPPAAPDHAYPFNSKAGGVIADSIDSDDLTIVGSGEAIVTGKFSNALNHTSPSQYLSGTLATLSGSATIAGWVYPSDSTDFEVFRISDSADPGVYVSIYGKYSSVSSIAYYLRMDDGVTYTDSLITTLANANWTMFGLDFDQNNSVYVWLNGLDLTAAIDVPTISANALLTMNVATATGADILRDEAWVWDSALLTAVNFEYLYNGQVGRVHPW